MVVVLELVVGHLALVCRTNEIVVIVVIAGIAVNAVGNAVNVVNVENVEDVEIEMNNNHD